MGLGAADDEKDKDCVDSVYASDYAHREAD